MKHFKCSPYLHDDVILSDMAKALRHVDLDNVMERDLAYAEAGILARHIERLEPDAISLVRVWREVVGQVRPFEFARADRVYAEIGQ